MGYGGKGMLQRLALSGKADVCLIQEGGTDWKDNREWCAFRSGKALILTGKGLRVSACHRWDRMAQSASGVDAVAVEVTGRGIDSVILFVSVYRHPTYPEESVVDYLREVLLQFPGRNVVVVLGPLFPES